jgi:DNA-binding CsgD family transcriptional regulator
VSEVAAGVGGVVLVSGEQGIGKSALLREGLAGAAAEGCRVGWVECDELRAGFPLWAMAQCLGAEGQAAAAGDVAGGPGWVLAGVERVLAVVDRLCAVSPVVLVAEDLQWADESSVLVWRRLARSVAQLPLLVVGSLRPGPGREELGQVVRQVAAGGGMVLDLGPLGADEVAELAAGVLGERPNRRLSGVLGQAGGNPLYVTELAAALVRGGRVMVRGQAAELAGQGGPVAVPGSLEIAIAERLAGLPAAVAGVLRWAAVLGGAFSAAELALVSGRPVGEMAGLIGEAVTAGVLADTGGRLGFRHALIRQILYEQIPSSVREALHLAAAQAMAAAGASAPAVAAQLTAAPGATQDWVGEWLAGHAAVLGYQAPAVAVQLLRQALSQLPSDDARRVELETALVRVASRLLLQDEVEKIAQPLLARTTDPDRAAEIASLLARTLVSAGRPAGAPAVLEQALARPGISPASQAQLRAAQALSYINLSLWDEAERIAQQALTQAEQAGDRMTTGQALNVLAAVEHTRRNAAGCLDYLDRSLAVLGDVPQAADLRLILLSNRASVLEDLDRLAEAETTVRQALALAEQSGSPRLLALTGTSAAAYYFETGQWDEALTVLETIAGISDPHDVPLSQHGHAALIAAHRGQWQQADEHLSAVQDQIPETAQQRNTSYHLLLARAIATERAGGPADAVTVLAGCLDPATASDMPERHLLLPSLARAAMAAADPATATAAARAAAQEAEREPLPAKTAAANWCQGLADSNPRPVLAAASYYQQAGRPLGQAQSLEDAAALLAGRGDLTTARQAFTTAARGYQELGADWDLRRADARLRGYGIRRGRIARKAATTGWQALTPAEGRIASLVAQGRTNPDIATELYLSRNTVQTHISHILAKLSARSRAEIIRQAFQHAGTTQNARLHADDHHAPASASTAAGVSWSRPVSTSPASSSAAGSGGYLGCGTAITRSPAAAADRRPLVESSTAAQSCGRRPSRAVTAR